jgi:sodium/bile acid cotransporter 2
MSPTFFYFDTVVLVSGLCLPLLGFFVGFAASSAACLPLQQRRTIALETGIQNTGIALTLITLSFNLKEASDLSQTPMLFAAGQIGLGFTVMISHVIYFCCRERVCKDSKEELETDSADAKIEISNDVLLVTEKETSLDGP